MHTGDVLIRIARAIGGDVAQAFPWTDFLEALRHSATGLYEARRGAIVEPFTSKPWTALLEERGWWSSPERSFDEFWGQLQDKGGWWDPIYYFGQWDRIFHTPSGKFEFYSLTLKDVLEGRGAPPEEAQPAADAAAAAFASGGDRSCLPHFEAPRFVGASEQYPFHMNIMRLLPLALGRNSNQPFLQEILDAQLFMRWDSWVEINPQAAQRLGIGDGDAVWVESPVGKVKTMARLNPGAMPHVVNMPGNLGHTAYGRWATDIGVNPMQITANEYDRLAGLSAPGATRVRVSKA
jgi:anaerobic selenocysteine-containing dehydrogenase